MRYPSDIIDRLSDNLKLTEQECWEWIGATNSGGYGVISYRGKQRLVHRLIWEMEFGSIPPNMLVCHSCDNTVCCNPEHLLIGTHQDNVDDMRAKGRDSYGQNKGEKNGQAVLTSDKVIEIRKLLADGIYTQNEIGGMFGVTREAISRIKRSIVWSWLQ